MAEGKRTGTRKTNCLKQTGKPREGWTIKKQERRQKGEKEFTALGFLESRSALTGGKSRKHVRKQSWTARPIQKHAEHLRVGDR